MTKKRSTLTARQKHNIREQLPDLFAEKWLKLSEAQREEFARIITEDHPEWLLLPGSPLSVDKSEHHRRLSMFDRITTDWPTKVEVAADQVVTERAAQPPELGVYLLWYLPKAVRENVIGDLDEEYAIVYDRFGRRKAVVWYYSQVIASFWPFAVSKIRALLQLTSQGWVIEVLRRWIS